MKGRNEMKDTISKAKAEEIVRSWRDDAVALKDGGANLALRGRVVMAVIPPYSQLKNGGIKTNVNRKTGWKIFCF
jgi:hypothetical protein